jgi:predicted RNA-binding protein with PUA-like domain
MTPMNYWLIKQEPQTYSWDDLVNEKKTAWTGVRNFQARNNLKAMKKGDVVCFYHTSEEKRIVGLATVAQEAYPDPTADEGNWVCGDVAPLKPFQTPVPLETIKRDTALKDIALVRHSRLSVMPLTPAAFQKLLSLGETKI